MKKNTMYVELMRTGGKPAVKAYNESKRGQIAARPNMEIEDRRHKKEKHKIRYESLV